MRTYQPERALIARESRNENRNEMAKMLGQIAVERAARLPVPPSVSLEAQFQIKEEIGFYNPAAWADEDGNPVINENRWKLWRMYSAGLPAMQFRTCRDAFYRTQMESPENNDPDRFRIRFREPGDLMTVQSKVGTFTWKAGCRPGSGQALKAKSVRQSKSLPTRCRFWTERRRTEMGQRGKNPRSPRSLSTKATIPLTNRERRPNQKSRLRAAPDSVNNLLLAGCVDRMRRRSEIYYGSAEKSKRKFWVYTLRCGKAESGNSGYDAS